MVVRKEDVVSWYRSKKERGKQYTSFGVPLRYITLKKEIRTFNEMGGYSRYDFRYLRFLWLNSLAFARKTRNYREVRRCLNLLQNDRFTGYHRAQPGHEFYFEPNSLFVSHMTAADENSNFEIAERKVGAFDRIVLETSYDLFWATFKNIRKNNFSGYWTAFFDRDDRRRGEAHFYFSKSVDSVYFMMCYYDQFQKKAAA